MSDETSRRLRPHELDPISNPPDIEGKAGRAWRVDYRGGHLRRHGRAMAPDDPGLALWLIEAPYAHPVWHSYTISLCHLRPILNDPGLTIHVPGATHEFVLYALDPVAPRQIMLDLASISILEPANFVAQINAPTDELATLQITVAIRDICNGLLSPDTDNRGQWMQRFGAGCMKEGLLTIT